LVIAPGAAQEPPQTARPETLVVLGLAAAAALAYKAPALFGVRLCCSDEPFQVRNASLFLLPLLAA
jgi:hypothetical protein